MEVILMNILERIYMLQSKTKLSNQVVMLATTIGVLLTSPFPAYSQGLLEEVIVTARKREESMQDVPISVQAFAGDSIAEQGIVDIQALAPYTPNFSYANAAGASDLLIMRGLGTLGSGVHFEPSVGQQFNGYYSTRSRLGRTAFMDLAQVEVLKGPQGVIIGRNNSLGALNIRSNKPTDEFEAKISTEYNFEASEGYEIEGVVSGPMTDRIRGRVAANWRDVDGWVKNLVTGADAQTKEDLTIRAMLDFDVTDNLLAEFMYQRSDIDREGKARVIKACLDPAQAAAVGTSFNCTQLVDTNSTVNILGGVDQGEPFTTESDLFGLTLTWDVGNFEVTSATSYNNYDITDQFSGDQTPNELVFIANEENYSQFMQEIRIASSVGDNLDYQFGGTYFTSELDFFQTFHALPGVAGLMAPVSRNEFATADQDSWSIFGAGDLRINEQLTLSLGGRYTKDDFDGTKSQVMGIYNTTTLDPNLCAFGGFLACTRGNDGLQAAGTAITGDLDDDDISFNVSLQYAHNDDNMYYVSYAEGYKAGGFDLRGAGNPAAFIFGDEQSQNVEIGGKHTLLDSSLRVNWSAFITNVDDLQISSNNPQIAQQIVGQAQVQSKGLEVDILWAATEGLTLTFTGAYLDAEYEQFESACYQGQTAATGCTITTLGMGPPGAPTMISGFGGAGGTQILDGQDTAYAPEFSFVLGGNYIWQVGNGMDLETSAKWLFIDDQWNEEDHDPLTLQGASNRIDASVVLSGTSGNHFWTLGVIGKNLTNELVFQFINPSSLSRTNVSTTNIEETRAIALRGTIDW